MTGFASLTREDESAVITVTVKGVNHRFLDMQVRAPSALAAMESRLRSIVQQRVARGRIELTITVQPRKTAGVDIEVNDSVIEGLASALDRARERGLVAGGLAPGDILRFPQAVTIRERQEDLGDRLAGTVENALDEALEELDRMRVNEGGHLRADLDARRVRLGEMFERAAASAAQGAQVLRARLADRVAELRSDPSIDPAAIAQEIVRFANRSDITEETVRFRAHLEHWRALSDAAEPCGRKLDFLLQEMNREVNTLGSKAEGQGVAEFVVALKAELEKMREQVQNVE
ncbi:MAG TPA: YicC/YloC family endoribonuclease [Vicinamibacterales bacterium]|nr:YicC/YloC family endoribonuclease [Vicinamibacterales bacterium]